MVYRCCINKIYTFIYHLSYDLLSIGSMREQPFFFRVKQEPARKKQLLSQANLLEEDYHLEASNLISLFVGTEAYHLD